MHVLKKLSCQPAEDGKIITPKHVGAILKMVRINYKVVHLMVLREFFSGYSEFFDILLIKSIRIFCQLDERMEIS